MVLPELDGQRLDLAAAALSGLSRRRVRALAADGCVWLNGKAVRILSRVIHLADVVDVVPGAETLAGPAGTSLHLDVIHEDGWIIAVDKPAGVASQAPRRRGEGELTVQELLAVQLAAREGQRTAVLLIHRLDRLTTGVLVFARQHEAARALARTWAAGRADKRYLTVVRGDPGEAQRTLSGAIAADPNVAGRFRVARGGRPARTEFRRLATAGGLSLLEVHPLTGRTHQVRVHLAEAGFPVAGDALYGGGRALPRPLLHAWRLRLPHPRTGRPVRLEAPLPPDMAALLREHGFAVTLPPS